MNEAAVALLAVTVTAEPGCAVRGVVVNAAVAKRLADFAQDGFAALDDLSLWMVHRARFERLQFAEYDHLVTELGL